MVPLTRPETTMKSKTRTLMQVKTLFTIADSLTPNASSPERNRWEGLCEGRAVTAGGRELRETRTGQGDDNDHGEHVRVLGEHARGFHGHVLSAEMLDALPYQLVKGGAPCTRYA